MLTVNWNCYHYYQKNSRGPGAPVFVDTRHNGQSKPDLSYIIVFLYRASSNWVLMVRWWWHFDWSFARLIAPVVTTTSIILCFNEAGEFIHWSLHYLQTRSHRVRLGLAIVPWHRRPPSTNTGAPWPLRNFLIIMVTISVDRHHYR